MNYYNPYEKFRLDELGISSDEEAEELEYELDLRFEDFTPKDRRTWLRQNDYIEHFSRTRTVTSAANKAGVTVFTAQRWKYDNVLGFTRRLEVAVLTFNDRLKQKALLRASDPKAPATLLTELLRAYIPEEFSRNGHKCDTSKSDELLRRYRENARREMEAGHPRLRKMAEGATNAYPKDDLDLSPTHLSSAGEPSPSHLSSAGGETQRGGSSHPSPYSHQPSSPTCHTGGGRYPEEAPQASNRTSYQDHNASPSPDAPSVPSAVNPATASRAQRREQLRQQRKAEKKNTFPVKRF